MTKPYKKRILSRPKTINKMLWLAFPVLAIPLSYAENNTNFSDSALSGAQKSYGPNVTLALSVEFPTAGAAYSSTREFTSDMLRQEYIGYFDSNKCYVYVAEKDADGSAAFTASGFIQNQGKSSAVNRGLKRIAPIVDNGQLSSVHKQEFFFTAQNGAYLMHLHSSNRPYISDSKDYFRPTRYATKNNGMIGICDGADEFSGNFLNWASMSAIDIFRKTMTGGNRALGNASDESAYHAGDTPTQTFLRRANVVADKNRNTSFMMQRNIYLTPAEIKLVLPHEYGLAENTNLVTGGKESATNPFFLYKGYGFINEKLATTVDVRTGASERFPGNTDYSTPLLVVQNLGFGFDIRRKVLDTAISYYYYAPLKKRIMPYQAAVQVCVDGLREDNCTVQPNGSYKPTGLMQKNATTMRFSAWGYANIDSDWINGGLLRSRMRYIVDPRSDVTERAPKYQVEINPQTGQFYTNPDRNAESTPEEAFKVVEEGQRNTPSAHFKNSGIINYLNKFGDTEKGYKSNDPAAELYYSALSYLRNKGYPAQYQNFHESNGTARQLSSLTEVERDSFPAIIDNLDNPLDVYQSSTNLVSAANTCRPNYLVFIGDTNTWSDNNLPGSYGATVTDSELHVANILRDKIIPNEGANANWTSVRPSGPSAMTPLGSEPYLAPWGAGQWSFGGNLAALAYWGHTNELQTGFNNKLNTFMIDVVEGGNYKPKQNSYYLAAKYGSFNDINENGLPDPGEWESSAADRIAAFSNAGLDTPNNYAAANSPETMVKALERAFEQTSTAESPSATSLTLADSSVVLANNASTTLLQSVFRDTSTLVNGNRIKVASGDVLALTATLKGTNLEYAEQWSAGSLLNSAYHNTSGWKTRNVFTRATSDSNAVSLYAAGSSLSSAIGAGTDTTNLVNYVLGDTTNENVTKFRQRPNYLMGTVINSPVLSITKGTEGVSTPAGACTHPSSANMTTRAARYAVAANDGMFHVFNSTGNEIGAYMPSTALPLLPQYASQSYKHFFMNDGMAATAEVCFTQGANGARTVVVGSAGRGGNSVYALDLTNPSTLTAQNMLWEFTHPDLGKNLFEPIITHDKTGAPIAIVSGGYNASNDKGYIFVLRLDKPAGTPWREDTSSSETPWGNGNWYRIELGASGVGEMFAYRSTRNTVDSVYVGDLGGYLWKVSQNSQGRFVAGYTANDTSTKNLPIFKTDAGASIVGAPYAQAISGKTYIVFITGRYFNENDLPTATRTVQNYAYGVIESKIGTNRSLQSNGALISNAIGENNLLEQEIDSQTITGADSTKTFYSVSENEIKASHEGWRLKLLPNWLSVDKSGIRGKRVAEFSTVNPMASDTNGTTCTDSGSTYSISVNVFNGGLYKKSPLYDTNADGLFDSSDTLVAVAGQSGLQTRLTQVATEFGFIAAGITTTQTTINLDKNQIISEPVIKRVSWREIF